MTTPIRLRLLTALKQALEEITVANGWQNDLAGKVYLGRTRFDTDSDPCPIITILEQLDDANTPAKTYNAQQSNRAVDWTFRVMGFVQGDTFSSTDAAYILAAEVQARISAETLREDEQRRGYDFFGLGPEIDKVLLGSYKCFAADEASAGPYFILPVTVSLVEPIREMLPPA